MSKKVTQRDFIDRSVATHGDTYDYSKSIYQGNTKKVEILCKEHGVFLQAPAKHWAGQGCPECKKVKIANALRGDPSKVLEECSSIHKGKYDYSQVKYKNLDSKVDIICPEHGPFSQTLANHRKGKGCPECKRETLSKSKIKSQEAVLQEFNSIHGDRYDYSKVIYKNSDAHVTIICKEHGVFKQKPQIHLSGKGCPRCGNEKCAASHRLTTQQVVDRFKEVNGDRYDYHKTVYAGDINKVIISCRRHGDFYQLPSNHYAGHQCSKCRDMVSKEETHIFSWVRDLFPDAIQSDRAVLGGKELDIYIPSKNLAIEFNGVYWHSDKKKDKYYHYNKFKECKDKGIRLIQITDFDWKENKDKMENIILNALGVVQKEKLNARDCTVVEIPAKECKDFFDMHHPQGHASNKVNIALNHKTKGIVAIMSFGFGNTSRGKSASSASWELSRYATSDMVRGGASKLFKYFITNYSPTEVKSFSMNDWFSGSLYEVLGFNGEQIKPDYRVYHSKTGMLSKSHWQRRNIPKRLSEIGSNIIFNPDTDVRTEFQIEDEVGALRVWDSGKTRWLWKPLTV